MDTYFQNGLSPGDAPVPWQLALIEDPNWLTREVRQALMQDSAGNLPGLAAQLELQNVCLQEAVRFPQRVICTDEEMVIARAICKFLETT